MTREPAIDWHADALLRMSELMRRRGPDDAGVWNDGSHLALAFRRLSIIDPSPAGHQPMVTPDGRYAIVFNGELYNYQDLRRELEQNGTRFHSQSDTEVVLHSLAQQGPRALSRFSGMFALGWYDVAERRLLLARDALGIKPLYYLDHPEALVFGSQYDQLLVHPFCNRERIQLDCLGLYLRLGYLPAPYGLLAGTHQLPAGHWLETRPGEPPVVRCFYALPSFEQPRLRGAEAEEALDAALAGAVRRHLVSDVPVGCFLSGGVDSPLVAAFAKQSSPAIAAFSIGSSDPRFDESTAATEYARQLGLEHHLRVFTQEDALGLLADVAAAYGEPFADFSAFPSLLLSSETSRHVKVALSGDGGDELFFGYPRFLKVLQARRYFLKPRWRRTLAYAGGRARGGGLPPRGILSASIGDWYLSSHSGLSSAEVQRLCPEAETLPPSFRLFEDAPADDEDALAQWLRGNELIGHLQMVLLKMDRASMHFGLEVRVPLLDPEVVACALRIAPSECMNAAGDGKLVLRKLLARHVRAESIPTPKMGFDIPLGRWLRTALRRPFEELLLENEPYPPGRLCKPVIAKIFRAHLRGGSDRARGLWNLLSLQLWARSHLAEAAIPLSRSAPGRLVGLVGARP